MWPFNKRSEPKPSLETRTVGPNYTAQVLNARANWITGSRAKSELTATIQTAVSLWEGAFMSADVDGTTAFTRLHRGIAARGLALRGEALFYMTDDAILPVSDWEVYTRWGVPRAYRISVSDAGGAKNVNVLAPEVLHFRIGVNPEAPWSGTSPLDRASLSSDMLYFVEEALKDVYAHAPLGSQIIPFPELSEDETNRLESGFAGRRGRVLLRESVSVHAAGGPQPLNNDWKPQSTTPDLQSALPAEMLNAAQSGILSAYGVLPALVGNAAQGPLVREAQRHLATWVLQPICDVMADELTEKVGGKVTMDVLNPMQAFDTGGRARAMATIIQAMAQAKEAGVDPAVALKLVDWDNG